MIKKHYKISGFTYVEFKALIREMRRRNSELIRRSGNNKVMVGVSVLKEKGFVSINPHALNLKTGRVFARDIDGEYRTINIKELFEA